MLPKGKLTSSSSGSAGSSPSATLKSLQAAQLQAQVQAQAQTQPALGSAALPPAQPSAPLVPKPKLGPGAARWPSSGEEDKGDSALSVAAKGEQLCPSLVVPSGMEFVFVIREDVKKPRQEVNFNIVDLKGSPLSRVVISERDQGGHGCGIFLQTLTRLPLAMVNTEQLHKRGAVAPVNRQPVVCRPNGELFGVLKPDNAGKYYLKSKTGQKLFVFQGEFRQKAINVMNTTGKLICSTERCVVDFDVAPHYQVRIAPHVDAGLVICCLLAIDKLESAGSE